MAGRVKSIADTLGEGYIDTLSTFGEKSQASDNLTVMQDTFKSFVLNNLLNIAQTGNLSDRDMQNTFRDISGEFNTPLGKGYGLGFGFNTPSPMGDMKDDYRFTLRKKFEEGGLVSQSPTKEYMTHLSDREGFRSEVYLDTLGFPTGGTGHLLTDEEKNKYKEGATIPEPVTTEWLKKDSAKAYESALSQAKELGIEDQDMINALGSVNFQLGTDWKSKFKGVWKAMKSGNFDLAAKEAMYKKPNDKDKGHSKWYTQTPVRVEDFVTALSNYGGKVK